MSTYLTEDEQIELIKKWWRTYGNLVTTSILAVVLVIVGWRFWQQRQEKIRVTASSAYEQLLMSVANNDKTGIEAQANNLKSHFASTPYAKLAVLQLAQQAAQNHKLPQAQQHLEWVVQNAKDHAILQIAKIRLARILLAEKKERQALSLLEKIEDPSFTSLVAEGRGDIYMALGDKTKARQSYKLALEKLPEATINRSLVEMKYHELAPTSSYIATIRKAQAQGFRSKQKHKG